MTTEQVKQGHDWVAQVMFPLMVVLMEAFWISPWLIWVGNWPLFAEARPAMHLPAVALVLAAALLLTRFATQRTEWSLRLARSVIIGSGVAALFIVLYFEYPAPEGTLWFAHLGNLFADILHNPSSAVLALPVMVYLWWRGIMLGRKTLTFRDVYRAFITGMVLLIVLLIIWQLSAGSGSIAGPGTGIGWNVIGFFVFGLLSIAICHLYSMRQSMAHDEAARFSLKRWLPVMFIVIGVVVVVGLGLAAIFSPEFFATVGDVFIKVRGFLWRLAEYILVPLNFIFEGILWLLRAILSLLRRNQPENGEMEGAPGELEFDEVIPKALPPMATEIIKWVIVALLIIGVIYFLARTINRFLLKKQDEDIEEIHESLFSWDSLGKDLNDMLNSLKNRFTIHRSGAHRRSCDDDLSGNLDVREIYRRVLWEAEQSGLPRRPHETTTEYVRRVGRLLPEGQAYLSGVTDAYVPVRYGEKQENAVRETNGLWQRLRAVLRSLRGEQTPPG